ncbi:WRKY DNA-binding transcription factor 70-like [Phoenix dactylifera]|uniref:WRKY DNA-binding transcription factor 70-like n=1 Tax=Phoenix dactylifera TaxID=42345 RepID=A0A8B7C5K2_PHODC|nr:WRKY DNA-binding transcription factor 70-like [Phoenix dactylifera]
MGSLEQENSSIDRINKVAGELIKGKESAIQLKSLLQESFASEDQEKNSVVGIFIEEILGSFSRAFTILNSGKAPEAPLDQAATPCSEEQESKNSGKKRKIQSSRRSGYRRRAHLYSCTRILSKTMDDDHTWRKYGQKDIFNSKYPRSYFRCTHKYDQQCQATRQVQQSEADPSMYVITYMGEHTCRDPTISPHLLPPSHRRPSSIISFGSETTADDQKEVPFNSSCFSVMKQEIDEEVPSDPTPRISSSEFLMLPDLGTFDWRAPMEQYMGIALDQCDAMSDMHSSNSCLDMELNGVSFELDDLFGVDQDKLF